ncbi:unnamed protein product [Ilex paraguariensis]|uniref:Uncharacterized protein n=1 Tax=Ilex paraguariensis TaxID=185542 RepID=A0ABC8V1Z1_9AQUA
MRQMNNAMSSLFGNPFGNDMFGGGGGGGSFPGRPPSMAMMPFSNPSGGLLSPFPFPNMNPFMQSMSQMSNDPNCHSFSTSSMTTMTTGPDGKPQVYRESSSMRAVPGGVCETKKTVCDSRTGVKKMAIGRHIAIERISKRKKATCTREKLRRMKNSLISTKVGLSLKI